MAGVFAHFFLRILRLLVRYDGALVGSVGGQECDSLLLLLLVAVLLWSGRVDANLPVFEYGRSWGKAESSLDSNFWERKTEMWMEFGCDDTTDFNDLGVLNNNRDSWL